jgi:hypothetical protein
LASLALSRRSNTFNIVNLETQLPVAQAMTGREAALLASEWFNRTKVKHKPIPIVNPRWFDKYFNNEETNYNLKLPHVNQPWFYYIHANRVDAHHFLKPSCIYDGEVEFFEDDIKGTAGIRTHMGYGRYLERYFSKAPYNASKDEITRLASEFNAMFLSAKFGIAETSQEIEEVFKHYTGGYSCCIFKDWAANNDGAHPSCFINPEEIQVAFIRGQDKNGQPSYTGRTLVRSKTKEFEQYIRGDIRLKTFLENDGWKSVRPEVAWVGVKANKVLGKNGIPKGMHLDHFNNFIDKGDHLELSNNGDTHFQATAGYASSYKRV